MKIIVPATSANVGPGFDSVGVAVSKYLTVEMLEPTDKWQIDHDLGAGIPKDESNLLLATALQIKADLPPHRLRMTSDIPLARGLGSSSSVIVAGIELANQLGQLNLSDEAKLNIATEIEGHPDNVAPAIYGNLVVASYLDHKVSSVVAQFPDAAFIAFIPNYELKTSDSRQVLPTQMSYKEAVTASAIANVAVAALIRGDLKTAARMIDNDLFHERFRQGLVKEFATIKAIGQAYDAYATYLSGAGPTVMILAPRDKAVAIQFALNKEKMDGQVFELTVDTQGLRVE